MTFLKPILTSTAIVAMMSSGAFAESHSAKVDAEMKTETSVNVFDYDTVFSDVSDMRADDLVGTPVVLANGERVGEIDRIGTLDGQPVLIVGIGGFLGIGEHNVAMTMDQLEYDRENEEFVAVGYTEEQLETLPEYSEDRFAALEGDQALNMAWGDRMASQGVTDDSMTSETGEDTVATIVDDDAMPADGNESAVIAGDEALPKADDAMESDKDAVIAGDEALPTADDATESDKDAVIAGDPLTPKADDDAMAQTDNPVVAGDPVSPTTNPVADPAVTPRFDYGTQYADIAEMPVNEIIGTRVYAGTGEDVGEVDNVGILDAQPIVVVGIGGFLGLGEHDVALNLDRLEYDAERQALIVSGYTKDELKQIPEIDTENIGFLESEAPLSSVWSETGQ